MAQIGSFSQSSVRKYRLSKCVPSSSNCARRSALTPAYPRVGLTDWRAGGPAGTPFRVQPRRLWAKMPNSACRKLSSMNAVDFPATIRPLVRLPDQRPFGRCMHTPEGSLRWSYGSRLATI